MARTARPASSASLLNDADIEERFIRASGPGGQNVNKVATAVELRFNLRGSSLPEDVKVRLAAIAGRRLSADGILVIDSRVYRSQAQNREAARARLDALVERASTAPRRRKATKPKKAAKEKRLESKRQRSAVKSLRSPRGRGED